MWFHGLIAALIAGGANAAAGVIGTSLVLPAQVNTGSGFHTALTLMGVQFAIGAVVGVIFYLKQSPVPAGWDGTTDRRGGEPKP
jgi:hypothetical protein